MPATDLRKRLRAAGHALSAVVQIGKLGANEAVLKQVSGALTAHELVKVKVNSECPLSRFEVAEQLATISGASLAQIMGGAILVYRRDPNKARFEKAK
jgi:RNA-binding protein